MASKSATASAHEVKEIDASIDPCCWIITCPIDHYGFFPYKTTLLLEKEEVVKTDVTICGKNVSRRPYGELGNVDRGNCCCFVEALSSFGPVSPGCGCDAGKVDEIVDELKTRMKTRGDTAQIQRAEEQLERLGKLETKIDLIMDRLNIPQPAEDGG